VKGFAHVCVCEGGKTGGDIGRCRLHEGRDDSFLLFAAQVTLKGAKVEGGDKGLKAVGFIGYVKGHELGCKGAEDFEEWVGSGFP